MSLSRNVLIVYSFLLVMFFSASSISIAFPVHLVPPSIFDTFERHHILIKIGKILANFGDGRWSSIKTMCRHEFELLICILDNRISKRQLAIFM